MSDTHPVTEHIERVCKEAGLGMMTGVFDVIADREEVTEERLLQLTPADVSTYYETVVGGAIDRIEDDLLGKRPLF